MTDKKQLTDYLKNSCNRDCTNCNYDGCPVDDLYSLLCGGQNDDEGGAK